jgi:hypothetical protein
VKCEAKYILEWRHAGTVGPSSVASTSTSGDVRVPGDILKKPRTEMWLTKTFPSSSESPHSKRAFSECSVQFLLFLSRSNHCPQTRSVSPSPSTNFKTVTILSLGSGSVPQLLQGRFACRFQTENRAFRSWSWELSSKTLSIPYERIRALRLMRSYF